VRFCDAIFSWWGTENAAQMEVWKYLWKINPKVWKINPKVWKMCHVAIIIVEIVTKTEQQWQSGYFLMTF